MSISYWQVYQQQEKFLFNIGACILSILKSENILQKFSFMHFFSKE